jgi:hypothetical protein
MNVYKMPKLKKGDVDESYIFFKSVKELVTVRFTKWNGDNIEEAIFTIQRSPDYRNFHSTYTCTNEIDGKDTQRLALHAIFGNTPTPRTQSLEVKDLDVTKKDFIQFCYIRYLPSESYSSTNSCKPPSTQNPDVILGGIVRKP